MSTDEMQTEFFARLDPPGLNPYEPGRALIDGNGRKVGVAMPSSAFPGSLMICLDVTITNVVREAGLWS